MKFTLGLLDRPTYAVIAARRKRPISTSATTFSPCCCRRRTEEGDALTDHEVRDELLSLVLAGHETTANSLAWAWERLVRTPGA